MSDMSLATSLATLLLFSAQSVDA